MFDETLGRMLSGVPDDMDKRSSSVIYNSLAPAAMEIAGVRSELEINQEQSFFMTANGENLDRCGENLGVSRLRATHAIRNGETRSAAGDLFNAPIGSRFAVPDTNNEITFVLAEYIEVGACLLRCEQAGSIGNEHQGELLPLQIVNGLGGVSITSVYFSGSDQEPDEAYRLRIRNRLKEKPFAGNIAAYRQIMQETANARQTKVFPAWQGGGTVLISALDANNAPFTPAYLADIKNLIDPAEYSGEGVGIAPIGHSVTIVSPTFFDLTVSANLTLDGVTTEQINPAVIAAINLYLQRVTAGWESADSLTIFVSNIVSAIVAVERVVDVTGVLLNGQAGNIVLESTAQRQLIPRLSGVEI
jgi:uncharacterized phage protein gp47/JayE